MKTVLSRITVCIGIVFLLIPGSDCYAKVAKNALVIGNSSYKTAHLANPVNDAKDMAFTLKKLGFKVRLKTNASRRTMTTAIRDFGKKLQGGGVGLFYFAGHGVQVGGRNYLIPVKANIEVAADVEFEAVDAGRILANMEDAGNGFNIIILDACRNNPFARSFRSGNSGLVKMDAPTGSILAYSTAPGAVAADGTGRNGLYTSKLLKHMVTPNLKIEEVFKRVRIDVAEVSGNKQTPWELSSLMGDFYFNSGRSISVVKRPPSAEKTTGKKTQRERPPETAGTMNFETRELRYAQSLFDRGKKAEAKRVVNGLLKKDDETILAEAMYCQILWGFATNDRETVEKLSAYYPDSIWLASAEQIVAAREEKRKAGFTNKEGFTNRFGMKFVYIRPGTFMMGSPSSESYRGDDERQHRVTLTKGFHMQTTEVTQGQWRTIMGNNPSYFKNCGDNCPVEQVAWNDVQAFIRALNQKEGTNRYKLPTEAEWEYAARAGSTTALANGGITVRKHNCDYDSNMDAMGWYCGNSNKTTHPVALKQPNAWGLYDMHGNLEEWCQDWYDKNYPSDSVTDPSGPSSGSERVYRGGSWGNNDELRAAYRGRGRPDSRYSLQGFRLALAPGQ
jgi:formylglycine-generating enzyme required for sulfatase activity